MIKDKRKKAKKPLVVTNIICTFAAALSNKKIRNKKYTDEF